jgi:hypothetical protein
MGHTHIYTHIPEQFVETAYYLSLGCGLKIKASDLEFKAYI